MQSHRLSYQFQMMHSQLEASSSLNDANDLLRSSVPVTVKPSRLKRALSSGRLEQEESKRQIMSFQVPSDLILVDEEAISDDDKNKIELVEGDIDLSY